MKKNPWLPWKQSRHVAITTGKEQVLVIIPTAGRNIHQLRRCLESLHSAASSTPIHPVVVLCPATAAKVEAVKKVCRGLASVVPLAWRFNYCRSINEGLRHRAAKDSCVLLLNDDVTFASAGALQKLVSTLRKQRWACVGPYVAGWHDLHSSVPRQHKHVRTNEPVNGCCALWDLAWMDRIGGLDEQFGNGWGLDEADACLRALRRGAQFGREDRVAVSHEGHATFGSQYTDLDGPAHRRNLRLFASKYGREVGTWGQTHHWLPLPGVQVSIAAHNAGKWFKRCLASVERAMDGYRWSLVIGDDCSSDATFEIAKQHAKRTSADVCIVKQFKRKALTVDQAKNRVLRMGSALRSQYPAMCLMDADDEMTEGRVRHLLWQARDNAQVAVAGDYIQSAPRYSGEHNRVIRMTADSQISSGFGPWATIFHASLIPRDSALFREHRDQISHGDMDLWLRWYLKGINIFPCPGEIVHRYHWHPGTTSRPVDPQVAARINKIWDRRRSRLLNIPTASVSAYSQRPMNSRTTGKRQMVNTVRAYSQPHFVNQTLSRRKSLTSVRAYSQPRIVGRVGVRRAATRVVRAYSQPQLVA